MVKMLMHGLIKNTFLHSLAKSLNLGNGILFPEFKRCCWLSQNAKWPSFLTFNDVFTQPKEKDISLIVNVAKARR